MKKTNTIRLVVILMVLLVIYAASEYFSNTGRSKSLRNELVTIESEAVTAMVISNKGQTTRISKSDSIWVVSDDTYDYSADPKKVANSLSTLQTIVPSRIATRNQEKWKDFQVDSAGMRVEVYEGTKKVLDIILGRFGMQGQQQFFTYVRLFSENDVYVVNNFMSFSLPGTTSGYRNGQVVSMVPDSIASINFQYPDSSFTLIKSLNNNWLVDRTQTDSIKVATYLNSLKSQISSNFVEGNPDITLNPDMVIEILMKNNEKLTVSAQKKEDGFLIESSSNTDAVFNDQNLFEKLFRTKDSFLSDPE